MHNVGAKAALEPCLLRAHHTSQRIGRILTEELPKNSPNGWAEITELVVKRGW